MIITQKRILIIDDSTTNVVLLEAIFSSKGYLIEKALNCKDAFDIIKKNIPDLILLDLLMPKYNGFEFLTDVKSDISTKGIPVIVVSALTDIDTVKRTKALGAVSFINKPVDIHKIVKVAEEILNNHEA